MTSSSSPAAKLSAYLSQLNPVPTFPDYTGPYKVGTVDVEIPVTELESPSPAPKSAADIYTVSCRIYYPAAPDSTGKPISWLPSPQRHHVSAYTQFVGIKPLLADFVSYADPSLYTLMLERRANHRSFLPRHLHYTTIPALKNADLLEPNTPNGRWPTMIFSHGLGGNRNTYSVVAGSLASHGIVVVCPEHRDGSAVASFVRIPQAQDSYFIRNTRRVVPYIRLPHDNTPEISTAREDQLRIRLWELGLAHAAILAIDRAEPLKNLNKSTPSLGFFAKKLHVHEPGSIIFAGHSFGSASIVQLLKSTYYAGSPALAKMERPLFTPAPDSELSKQITEKNVTMLLDMWCFPLLAPNSAPLFDLPLPAYANVPSAPGGKALLAVESDAFYKWTEHLHVTARVLSPDPSQKVITADLYQRNNGIALPEPNFFYVEKSAHLSQSDFGILFPWLTKRIFNSVEPERALRVNLRAQLQVLRANGVPVARTWVGDLVDGVGAEKDDSGSGSEGEGEGEVSDGVTDDRAIFLRSDGKIVDCWHWVETIGKGDEKKADAQAGEGVSAQVADVEASAPQMEAEIEPPVVGRTVSASA
ncbi:phospholipase A2 [Verticillium dahliae]